MKVKVERYFLILAILGISLGKNNSLSTFLKVFSFNYLTFLSLFGGIMVLGCLAPAMIDFFKKDRREKVKIAVWVCTLSSIFLLLPMTGFLKSEVINLDSFGKVYFKVKIHPLINFTTAIVLSALLGFIAFRRSYLEKGIREFGKGIEEIVRMFILPGFMLATPGILTLFNSEEFVNKLGIGYLKNIGIFFMGLLVLAVFFRKRMRVGRARGVYKILFVGSLVAPILIKNSPSIATIFLYLLVVSFSTVLNPKIPPMVALGLFAEMAEVAVPALGGMIVLYFICSGIERHFCSAFKTAT